MYLHLFVMYLQCIMFYSPFMKQGDQNSSKVLSLSISVFLFGPLIDHVGYMQIYVKFLWLGQFLHYHTN
jgi:hypothetical protein